MKIDEIDTNSEQIREILAKQPGFVLKWGISVIFIAVFLMLLATWIIKYPDIIHSEVILLSLIHI